MRDTSRQEIPGERRKQHHHERKGRAVHEDDAVKAHDRLRTCRPRASSEQELPEAPGAPRVPELSALLDEIDSLRLALSADLGLAASAVDVGALDVARDVISGGQHDVAGFSVRAEQLLAPREPVGHALATTEPPAEEPTEPEVPRARRAARRLALLAPTLTAAAALVGLLAGVVPSPGAPGAGGSPMTHAAHDSYAELWRLHDSGAPSSQLAQAARDLNTEVARLVALAAQDPASAEQAMRLLELELALLDDPQHGDALGPERAASQRLLARLRQALGGTPVGEVLAKAPRPGSAVVTPLVVVPLPEAPAATPDPPRLRPEPSASATPTPTAESTTEAEPASEPSPAPEQDEEPDPTPEPEPSPGPPGSLLPPSAGLNSSGSALGPPSD